MMFYPVQEKRVGVRRQTHWNPPPGLLAAVAVGFLVEAVCYAPGVCIIP